MFNTVFDFEDIRVQFYLLASAVNYLKSVENRILNFSFIFLYRRRFCEKLVCFRKNTKTFIKKQTKKAFLKYISNFCFIHMLYIIKC